MSEPTANIPQKPKTEKKPKVQLSIDSLGEATLAEVQKRSQKKWEPLSKFLNDVTSANLGGMLKAAEEEHAISASHPITVRLETEAYIQFKNKDKVVELTVLNKENTRLEIVKWDRRKYAPTVLADLVETLRKHRLLKAAELVANGDFLAELVQTIQIGMEARIGEPPAGSILDPIGSVTNTLAPVIERVDNVWVVTVRGLEDIPGRCPIPADKVVDDNIGNAAQTAETSEESTRFAFARSQIHHDTKPPRPPKS